MGVRFSGFWRGDEMRTVAVLFLYCFALVGGGGCEVVVLGEGSSSQMAAVEVDPAWSFPSSWLRDAYVVLQTWKQHAIFSDPRNLTDDWVGLDVCNYTGVFCMLRPKSGELAVVGINPNHGNIAGYLPSKLGLLADLVWLRLNSNCFRGLVPDVLCL